jgi:hypothetical protein
LDRCVRLLVVAYFDDDEVVNEEVNAEVVEVEDEEDEEEEEEEDILERRVRARSRTEFSDRPGSSEAMVAHLLP